MNETIVDNDINTIVLKEGIIFANYKPETIVTLEVAKRAVQDRKSITGVKRYPLCGDIRNLVKVEHDARDYLGSPEAFDGLSCLAIITANPIQKLFANFFLRFKASPVPTRLFTSKEKAIFWLKNRSELN